MHNSPEFLTQEQKQFFVDYGYIKIANVFSREIAQAVQLEIEKLCIAECDTTTFDITAITQQPEFSQGFFRPNKKLSGEPATLMNTEKVFAALDAVVGKNLYTHDDFDAHGLFTMTFPGFTHKPWQAPAQAGSWHIDNGVRFEEYYSLESCRCACVPVFLLTDVKPEGGATVCIPGSHKALANIFRQFGFLKYTAMRSLCEIMASSATQIHTLHGNAGDLVIMHPFLVHSPSANTESTLRIMSNTALGLVRGRNYDPSANNLSLIEASIAQEIYNQPITKSVGARIALQFICYLRPWRKHFCLYPQWQPDLTSYQKIILKLVIHLQRYLSLIVFGKKTIAYYQKNLSPRR